jgi:hypothetical protein
MRRQRRPPSVVRSRKYRAVPFADSCTPVAQRVFVVTRASCEPSPPGIPPMRRHVEPPPPLVRARHAVLDRPGGGDSPQLEMAATAGEQERRAGEQSKWRLRASTLAPATSRPVQGR